MESIILSLQIKQLQSSLKEVQDICIGLFRNTRYEEEYHPVIEDRDGVLTVLSIGNLLGMSTLCIGADQGHYVSFTHNGQPQTLSDMMAAPAQFNTWYKENCKW